jgi:hypothetical protein
MVELELIHVQLDEAFATQTLGERQRSSPGYVAVDCQRCKDEDHSGYSGGARNIE